VFLKRVRIQSADKVALEREARIYEKLLRLNCEYVADVKDFIRDDEYVTLVTAKTMQNRGTRGYAAPEQFEGVIAHPSADIYSLGKTICFLVTGQTDVDFVQYEGWRNIIRSCINHTAVDRPPIGEVISELEKLTR